MTPIWLPSTDSARSRACLRASILAAPAPCGTGLLGPAKPVDAPLQPTGPYLRALGPGMQGVHMAAQTWPIRSLPPGRAGVDAQFAVADRAGFSEAIPDALQPLAGGVAPGDAPLQASRRHPETPAVVVAASLEAGDLPIGAAHGALGTELPLTDQGHAVRASGLDAKRDDTLHGDEQQEDQQRDQQPRGRRRRDVGTRGSEHATDGRDGRCPWAPPGRRTPPGPSRQPVGGASW